MNPDENSNDGLSFPDVYDSTMLVRDGKYADEDGTTKEGAFIDDALETVTDWILNAKICYKTGEYGKAKCYLQGVYDLAFDASRLCEKWALDQK